jgi:GntR family transcriptional regulator
MTTTAYNKLYNILRDQILDRTFAPGDKLPTEREICDNFGVSRITSRHALRLLEEQGLVERHRGKGTFVRQTRQKKIPIVDWDYTGSLNKAAPSIYRKLITNELITPPAHITEALGLFKSEKCLFVERMDFLKGEPVAFDRGYIPTNLATAIDEEMLVRVDFASVWSKAQGITFSHFKEIIEVFAADDETAERLKVKKKQPMLLVIDQMLDNTDAILSIFETIYRGDRFKLIATTSVTAL